MKRSHAAYLATCLLIVACARNAAAQDPLATGAAAAVPSAAAPKGLFGGFCAWLDGCKAKCCTTPLGMFMTSAVKPMSMMTGGIIPTPCSNAQQNSNSAASAIQQDAAQAKARAAEARFLGTVDCHYYPEAEVALINFLRADRSECVRLAAAQALGTGCCCSKKTIAALTIAVNGSEIDGNPGERSLRVRVAAYLALQNCTCLDGGSTIPSSEENFQPRPEMPETVLQPHPDPAVDGESTPQFASYYDRIAHTKSYDELVRQAQQTLAATEPEVKAHQQVPKRPVQSLFAIWQRTDESSATPESPLEAAPPFTAPQPTLARAPTAAPPWPATNLVPATPPLAARSVDLPPGYARLPNTNLQLPPTEPTPTLARAETSRSTPPPSYAPSSQPARSSFPPAFTNPGGPIEIARPSSERSYR